MRKDFIRYNRYKGNRYEIGMKKGEELATVFSPRPPTLNEIKIAQESKEMLESIYPPLIDEYYGLVEGGKFDEKAFLTYYFARGQGEGGCTAVFIAEKRAHKSNPILGRNYDWLWYLKKECRLNIYVREKEGEFLGYTHHPVGDPDLFNTQGFYIGISGVREADITQPGLQWSHIVDIVASKFSRVADAKEFLEEIPHIRRMCYLICDAQGDCAVAECAPETVQFRNPDEGYLIATNEMVHSLRDDDITCERYRYIKKMILNHPSEIDEEFVHSILTCHDVNICDCTWDSSDPMATLWSIIYYPKIQKVKIAPGPPCKQEYSEVPLCNISLYKKGSR